MCWKNSKLLMTCFLLCWPAILFAQVEAGPDLGIPDELKPSGQYATLKPKTDAKAITYIGMSGIDAMPSDFLADSRWFLLDCRGLPVGRYLFTAVGSLDDVHTRTTFAVVIGTPPPDPGPGPGPGPNPPGPNPPGPTPGLVHVVGEGFRTLVVWEDEDRPKLPREQLLSLTGAEVTTYLNTKCEKDENGRPDWHIWDDDFTDAQIQQMPERWREPYRDAVKAFRDVSVPVIALSNTRIKTGIQGELNKLPQKHVEIMQLLKKYGDN